MKFTSWSYPRYAFYLALCLCLLSGTLSAQGVLFTSSNHSFDQLTPKQNEAYQRTLRSEAFTDLQLIDIAPIYEVMGIRNLRVKIGGDDVLLNVETIEYVNESDYYIYAVREITGLQDDIGRATLQLRSMEGLKFGYLHLGDAAYQIDDLGGGQNILMKQVQGAQPGQHPIDESVVVKDPDRRVHELPTLVGGSRTNCDVRVLFLYTTSAAGKVTNATTTAQSHIDQANQALGNSGVSSSQLRFVLAGVETLNTVDETSASANAVLTDVRTDGTAQARRNANDADLVCLVADHQIASFGTTLGIAYRGFDGAPAPDNFGYSVIRLFASLNDKLFAHEGGHNMGCGHQNGNNNEPGFHKAHSWTWTTGILWWRKTNRRQTIMWATANSAETEFNYSNPNVNHSSGNATGTATANNAQTLRNNACAVAAYRSATANLTVGIDGPGLACPLESVCWSANVGGAPGPYTYQWSWTTNGSTYTNFGTGASACLSMFNFTAPQLITIRLQVTAPGQPTRTAFKDLDLIVPNNGQIICALKTADPGLEAGIEADETALRVAPNPADLQSEVLLHLAQDAAATIALYDLTGQKVLDIAAGEYDSGHHRFPVDASQIPAGVYLLRADTDSQRLMQRFVVTH